MTKIAFAGDWHGTTGWARMCLRSLGEYGVKTLVHVGDFAIGFHDTDSKYLTPVSEAAREHGITILIVPGNHENWDLINALPVIETGEYAGWLDLAPNIVVAPRGHRWEIEGVSFVGLGGGNSIDYQRRIQGRDWWREEAITQADLYRTMDGGHAEVMVAHVAPFNAVYQLDSMGWGETAVRYSDESRMVMGLAVDAVKPKFFFHGHYHVDKRQVVHAKDEQGVSYTTEYVSLGRDTQRNNLALFDLDTRAINFIPWPY